MAQAALKYELEMPASGGAAAVETKTDDREIDLVHLARQTLGDVALEREILSLFVVQSQVYLLRLQAAESQRDWSRAVHTIKGSAKGIGAFPLARAAEAAEALGGQVHDEAHRRAAQDLLERVSAANACVRSYLSQVSQ
ncbi:Hpt domain-containing protein [Tepidamorphus sp. 3E244]|uniref:Hpt domain-containing protein n=1 Tax=Tepidamorphus sp. 3E244 TaxID=3385498 RepID=UPI0038FC87E4